MASGLARIATLGLQRQYFRTIAQGIKTVEGRVNTPALQKIRTGDTLQFLEEGGDNRSLNCRVTRIQVFPNFPMMLKIVGLGKCLPGIPTVDEGVSIYRGFPGFVEGEKTHGVVAFHIKRLSHEADIDLHAL